MKNGIRWAVRDRYGNQIYLTEERWQHITEEINHPEMLDYEHELQMTIRWAVRKQDTLNSQKYRYSMAFDELADDNTHIIAIVLFRFRESNGQKPTPNNYIVTAYQKEIWW